MTLRFTVRGLKETQVAISGLPQELARRALLSMSEVAHERILRGADSHTRTGALYQSAFNRAITGGGREVGHDLQRAPYAPFVIFGTKPHVIRPRDKKALRWPSGNSFVFAKSVNHPGYAGDDYLTDAARLALDNLRAIIDRTAI